MIHARTQHKTTTQRILQIWWNGLSLIRKFFFLLGIGVVFLFIVSAIVYPQWMYDYKGILTLIGVIIVIIVGSPGDLVNILILINQEQKQKKRTKQSFSRISDESVRMLKPRLRGIPDLIPREETVLIMDQILLNYPVILTGEAGTGKSGIGIALVDKALEINNFPLLIDARRLSSINGNAAIREYFDIQETFVEAVERIGNTEGLMIIVDQLDNIAGTDAAFVLINTLIECTKYEGVHVVVITRYKEANERNTIRPLLEAGFREIKCGLLESSVIERILVTVGVQGINQNAISLASNLLNLDLMCETVKITGLRDISQIQDEISLWERYRLAIMEREGGGRDGQGDEFLAEAIRLAKQGLSDIDRAFMVDFPPNGPQKRLVSSDIITRISGRRYQYRHEKLQDYLFAWDACEQLIMPEQVYKNVDQLHRRNIIVWMTELYRQRKAPIYGAFLEDLLDG